MNSAPVTNTESTAASSAHWIAHLLQAGDSFYPTGSYAHSFGLEGLINAGVVRDCDTLRQFIFLMTLPALERAELPILVHAWRAFDQRAWARIGEVSVLSSALRTAREVRTASENIGRQRAEIAATLHPHSLAAEYVRRATEAHWPFAAPVSAAMEAHVFGAPLAAALVGYTYSALATVLAAAMKLLRIGQNAAQSLLTQALANISSLVTAAREMPFTEIGWFNPWLDIAAARHESADARLFIS